MAFATRRQWRASALWRAARAVPVLLLAACGGGSGTSGSTGQTHPPIQVTYANVGLLGIFDPAVSLDPASNRVWMSYSSVDPSANSNWGVGIRLGYTDNSGASWTDSGLVEAFHDVTVAPGISVTSPEPAVTTGSPGTWQSEVSTITYDPAAGVPAGERWKMLYNQILWVNNYPYYASYSWLTLRMASSAAGLAAAPATKLFGGYLIKNDATSLTNADAPIAGAPAIALDTLHTELNSCVFGEPSLLATTDAVYLALDCQSLGNPVQPYVVMFRCASPCAMTNSASWAYLGRVTTPADAAAISSSYKSLSAPAFTTQGGKYFLITTPVATSGSRYDGCRVYEFADLATGALRRDAGGNLLPPVATVTGLSGTHNGACAHQASLTHGILHSQLETTNPVDFRIYQSRVAIP